MLKRDLKKPETSDFLLRPRGTGKSTWIQKNCKNNTVVYDLLNTTELIQLNTAIYPEIDFLRYLWSNRIIGV
jgi:hypothetical protein